MASDGTVPFQSFAFTLLEDKKPRTAFRLAVSEGGLYDLSIQRGSAAHPTTQVKRVVPRETAERLRDALQRIGVFGWDERYGDSAAPGSRRWTLGIVFQEGVFSFESKGGSDAPPGFEDVLEELYRLDFPRSTGGGPGGADGAGGAGEAREKGIGSSLGALGLGRMGSMGGLSAGDIGAYASSGKGGVGDIDFSTIAAMFPGGDVAGFLADAQRDPQSLQRRMKEEFRHLPPDEQERLVDALAATGMGTREFWRRFFLE